MARHDIMYSEVTKEGLKQLKKEIEKLEKDIIPEIVRRLNNARKDGDLRENSAYISAKEDLAYAKDKLARLKEVVRTAKVTKTTGNTVGLGSTVIISIKGNRRTITITSSVEASPLDNKISIDSPIGKALTGKKKGDKVSLPNGSQLEIIDVKN